MKYSENELAALITEVETEFSKHLEKAEADKETEKLEKAEEVSVEASDSEKVAQADETTEEVVEKSEGEEEEVISFDYSDEDVAEMNEMYASMTKSEKEAHYKSIKATLFGNEEEAEKTEKTEETSEEKLEKTEEVPAEEKVAKSEDTDKVAELEGKLEKSEANYKELQKGFSELIEKLSKNVKKSSAPKQKAITKIEYIAKSEEENVSVEEKNEDVSKLAKTEISKRLKDKARTPNLSKADRDAINTYCLTETKDIESIRHLL